MSTPQERMVQRHIDKATRLFERCCKLIDSGALIEARELLYEYGFALLNAKDVLRQCKPSPLLDVTLDRSIQTGLHYVDYLDEAIEEEHPQ